MKPFEAIATVQNYGQMNGLGSNSTDRFIYGSISGDSSPYFINDTTSPMYAIPGIRDNAQAGCTDSTH